MKNKYDSIRILYTHTHTHTHTHTKFDQEGIFIGESDIFITSIEKNKIRISDFDLLQKSIEENCQNLEENHWYTCDALRDSGEDGDYWYVVDNFKIINEK